MKHEDDIEIPNVSNFIIKEQKLILKENYLKNYEKSITLKQGDNYEKNIK